MKTQHIEDIIEIQEEVIEISEIEKIIKDKNVAQIYKEKYSDKLYSLIMKSLTHKTYASENEAKTLFLKISSHLNHLNQELNRDVGISVATLDYLQNFEKTLEDIRLIEEEKSDVLLESSTMDDLTELYLRDIFDISIEKHMDEFLRKDVSLSLIMLDIDDFKKINDTYGHQRGDDVLKSIGKIVNSSIRQMDMAARYGGEEIAVLMPHTSLNKAMVIAQRIKEKIQAYSFNDFSITASFGISEASSTINSAELLIEKADYSLYQAKRKGKNRIEKFIEKS